MYTRQQLINYNSLKIQLEFFGIYGKIKLFYSSFTKINTLLSISRYLLMSPISTELINSVALH
jgi:hypothetical protein